MTQKAWKICKECSDAKPGMPKIHGQHPVYKKSFWMDAIDKGCIIGYWDWVADEDTLARLDPLNNIGKESTK